MEEEETDSSEGREETLEDPSAPVAITPASERLQGSWGGEPVTS